MSESYTETTHESYPKRVIGSIVLSIISLFFIYIIFLLFFHFENYAKLKQQGLSEAGKKVISVTCMEVNKKFDEQVIHLIGDLKSNETIQEPIFRFRFKALKVVREVEMFQWDEDVSTREIVMPGGNSIKRKTYSYRKVWSGNLIDSDFFHKKKYKNPKKFRVESDKFYVNNAFAGKFQVSSMHIRNLDTKFARLPSLKSITKGKYPGRIFLTEKGKIYLGKNPKEPRIGDLRISYNIAKAGQYSLIGEQQGTELAPFQSEKGVAIAVVRKGKYKPAELIKIEKIELSNTTWILRGVFLIFYVLFIYLIFRPTAVLSDVIPWFGAVNRMKIFGSAILLGILFSLATIVMGKCCFEQVSEMNSNFFKETIEKVLFDRA